MGRITTGVGLATGFPIAETVEKLMAISARPKDQVTAQSKIANDQKTAITQLTVLVVGLQLTGSRLSAATLYNQRTATSSAESLISARVNTGASPAIGQYNFTPIQTAQSQQLLSSSFASKTSAVGSAAFPSASADLSIVLSRSTNCAAARASNEARFEIPIVAAQAQRLTSPTRAPLTMC